MQVDEEKGIFSLTIRNCVMEDKGIYTCEILEFVKKDEDQYCDCIVDIEGIALVKILTIIFDKLVQHVIAKYVLSC